MLSTQDREKIKSELKTELRAELKLQQVRPSDPLEALVHGPVTAEKYVDCQVQEQENTRFAQIAIILQLALCVIFAVGASYDDELSGGNDGGMGFYYSTYQDVHVMIFVGFGFLMTFLSFYGFSSVGFNFFVSAFVIQFAIISNSVWHMAESGHWSSFTLNVTTMITADFAAGAVLITFGGILGKVSPLQLLVIAVIEIVFYGANETIGAIRLGAVDMGGSIFVHTFGAYFGLGCAWAMCRKDKSLPNHPKNTSTKTSDMFAMIGTLFLWMFWPSFNGALAQGAQQHRVVVNTVLSLCGSCFAAFLFSALFRKHYKFDMVDIQNATLAGGVAVGSSSDLVIEPWGAITIGFCAGFLSVYGYTKIGPWLERTIGLHDTCGIHNLHGMPGVMGAIGGAISASVAGRDAYGQSIAAVFPKRGPPDNRSAMEQGWYQIYALLITLVISIVGGIIAGNVAQNLCSRNVTVALPAEVAAQITSARKQNQHFDDSEHWVLEEEEENGHGHGDE